MAKPQTTAPKGEDWDNDARPSQGAPTVTVRCIVHTLPHTGLALDGAAGLGLAHKQEVEVPEHVALLMQERGQVEIL